MYIVQSLKAEDNTKSFACSLLLKFSTEDVDKLPYLLQGKFWWHNVQWYTSEHHQWHDFQIKDDTKFPYCLNREREKRGNHIYFWDGWDKENEIERSENMFASLGK